MCDACEPSGKYRSAPGTPERMAEIDKQTADRILEYGQEVTIIPDGDPPFGYSIGMTMYEKPEFFIAGPLPPRVMLAIINAACAMAREFEIQDGYVFEPDTLLSSFPVKAVAVDPERSEMHQAIKHFGEITALQLVLPDVEGNFPGDVGYNERFVQPIYPAHGD